MWTRLKRLGQGPVAREFIDLLNDYQFPKNVPLVRNSIVTQELGCARFRNGEYEDF
jgi:hypothetical protein